MTDISGTDIRLLDGSVLLVFLGLMRHRKATVVAEEMGLTQPAVSHALKRLRVLYGDPLFVRQAHGLEPTEKALALEPTILSAVAALSDSLKGQETFNPKTSEITLRIAGFDYELATLVPKLIAYMVDYAPKISMRSLTLSSDQALESLARARVDLVIGFFETLSDEGPPGPFLHETLYVEEYVVTARAGNPVFKQDLTPERYASAQHLLVTSNTNSKGLVDTALKRQGLHRNVHSTVPMFFPALAVLEHSDLISTLPREVAVSYADRFGLRYASIPLAGINFAVRAVWHKRDERSPARAWVLNLIRALRDGMHQTE